MKIVMPEQFRVTESNYQKLQVHRGAVTDSSYGANGVFYLPRIGKQMGAFYLCIVSDGMGWGHVSVSIPSEKRCPTWEEMCYIKSMFFEKDECVVQYHPSEKDYVNNHPYCLHLWQYLNGEIPTPQADMVGVKTNKY